MESLVCGVDEVGRGPLAGPVVAAACLLDREAQERLRHAGVTDSKKLSEDKRESLLALIHELSLGWTLAWVWPEGIEALNIHHASLLAMRKAVYGLFGWPWDPLPLPETVQDDAPPIGWPDIDVFEQELPRSKGPCELEQSKHCIIICDGLHVPDLGLHHFTQNIQTKAEVKADANVVAVSAASILAKCARDRWMRRAHQVWPRYGFDVHAGYPVPGHLRALQEAGPCPIHRLSWVVRSLERRQLPGSDATNDVSS